MTKSPPLLDMDVALDAIDYWTLDSSSRKAIQLGGPRVTAHKNDFRLLPVIYLAAHLHSDCQQFADFWPSFEYK